AARPRAAARPRPAHPDLGAGRRRGRDRGRIPGRPPPPAHEEGLVKRRGRAPVGGAVPRVEVSPRPPSAVGIDTGGTFTDFVALVSGRLVAFKLPSTPRAAERAVLAGLARLGATRASRVRHGSTVATNALLERKGARVVLLTTAGFEDLLEIGRQDRPDLYTLSPHRL